MASGPITSWEIDRETVQTVSDFIFLGSRITADGDCSHGINDTGYLGLVHWGNPEGWYGEGGGRGVQYGEHVRVYLWWICVDVWQNQYIIVN